MIATKYSNLKQSYHLPLNTNWNKRRPYHFRLDTQKDIFSWYNLKITCIPKVYHFLFHLNVLLPMYLSTHVVF